MNAILLDQIVKAVLYEGYILYPYRASSKKNRQRFTFGRVYPQPYSEAQHGLEPCVMQTECLARPLSASPALEVTLRFLHPMARTVGSVCLRTSDLTEAMTQSFRAVPELSVDDELFQSWEEAVEREIKPPTLTLNNSSPTHAEFPFRFYASREIEPLRDRKENIAGAILRNQHGVEGTVELAAQPVGQGLFKITARIFNQTPIADADLSDHHVILMRTFTSTHAVLHVQDAEFISMTDPPAECRALAEDCKSSGVWPILVGEENRAERDTLLASPIILPDYPQIAPESSGDFFDGAEVDEILTLRIQTMTDDEKREMRRVDEQEIEPLETKS